MLSLSNKKLNITIIGAGATYTPGIVNSILKASQELPLQRLVLLDKDANRLEEIGGFIRILLKEKASEVKVILTTDRKEAFEGMDILFAQIRTGGLKMRARDEQIPLRYGVVGQETCGPGGGAFAMRGIPDIIEIGNDIRKYAPHAWIINYSNPAAILADLWYKKFPDLKSLFICDMPIVIELLLAKTLGYDHKDLNFSYFGLNHFGWWNHIWNKDAKDLVPELRDKLLSGEKVKLFEDDHVNEDWLPTFYRINKTLQHFSDLIPNTYLQYYYYGDEMVRNTNPTYTRANRLMDTREKEVFEECRRCIAAGTTEKSSLAAGLHGDFIVDHAIAVVHNRPYRTTVNVPNHGSVQGLPYDAIVEVHGIVSAHGVEHFTVGNIPTFYRTLMVQQNAYEQLTVEAALEGSYQKALQALTLNRTIPSADVAKSILDDLIEENKGYWPELK